jgi:1-acyl-sn-glycerol-3-phosphate acyltransferase
MNRAPSSPRPASGGAPRGRSSHPSGSDLAPTHRNRRRAPIALLSPLIDFLDAAVREQIHIDPFQRDPDSIRRMMPLVRALNLYHGTEVRGWENLPERGPMLVVGNHSGGAATRDSAFFLQKWVEERGAEAPLYSLAYDLLFANPILASWFRHRGVVPANPENARRALAMGAAVLVFPGGDYEVYRPWRERNRIDFGGRLGFVELALRTGVPVVPMVIHGAHQSTIVLTRGTRIARVAGLGKLHVKIFPLIWNLPFGPTPAFVPSAQLPAKVTVQIEKPLRWPRCARNRAPDPAVLRSRYAEITAIMQRRLDALAAERPHPVLTRLEELNPLGPAAPRRDSLAVGRRSPTSRRGLGSRRPNHLASA